MPQEAKGPNSKLVESLAAPGVRVDARADSGAAAAPADAAPAAVEPAELPAGAPGINERLEQAAHAGRADDSCDYLEIINADPFSPEQLAVPLNNITRYTSQVGAAWQTAMCLPHRCPVLLFAHHTLYVQRVVWQAWVSLGGACIQDLWAPFWSCECNQYAHLAALQHLHARECGPHVPCPGAGLPGAHGRAAAREQRLACGDRAVHEADRRAPLAQDRCACAPLAQDRRACTTALKQLCLHRLTSGGLMQASPTVLCLLFHRTIIT